MISYCDKLNCKKIYINEGSLHLIQEGFSSVLYHFTNNIVGVLTSETLECTAIEGFSDSFHDNKNFFYFCTSRTRNIDRGYGGLKGARIELDGNLLKQKYKGRPVDYWGCGKSKETFEFEDRIITPKPFIPNALKYITRIDVWSERYTEKILPYMLQLAKEKGVRMFIYDNKKDYNYQTNNTINEKIEQMDVVYPPTDRDTVMEVRNKIDSLSGLIFLDCFDELQKNKENASSIVNQKLQEIGLSHLQDIINKKMHYLVYHYSFAEMLHLIAGGYNGYSYRKLNTSDNDGTTDGRKIMMYAVSILKKHGFSNMQEWERANRNNKENDEPTATQVNYVIINYGGGNSYINGERCFWDIVDKDIFFNELTNIVDEDEWNKTCDKEGRYQNRINHKSKNSDSFKWYIKRVTNNDNFTIYEGCEMLNKLFNKDQGEISCAFGFTIKPLIITRDNFDDYENKLTYSESDKTINALFGSWQRYMDYKYPKS